MPPPPPPLPEPPPPALHLHLLGGFRVEQHGQPVGIPRQKAVALLALLATSAPHRVSRALLRGLLWADSSEEAAQNSLRNTLWFLKGALETAGYRGLHAGRTEVWLEPGSFATDLQAAEARLARGEVAPELAAGAGFPGNLLAGITATDLFDRRIETWRRAAVAGLTATAAGALAGTLAGQQAGLLWLLTELQPLDEAHCRALIRLLVQEGRKAEALAVYQRLWTALDEEYGEEPSAETQAVIVALKQAQDSGAEGSGSQDDRPVILVRGLPEHAGGESGGTSGAASGGASGGGPLLGDLRILLLSALARFREWRVMDAGFAPDPAALERRGTGALYQLGLAATAAGPGGAGPRVEAILTEMRTGQLLWSETLTAGAADLAAAVRRFALAMNLRLTGAERPRPAPGSDLTRSHYELWIEAQQKMRSFTIGGWHEAEGMLDRVLAENPRHARALAARASIETMRQIAFPGTISAPAMHRRALGWATAATQADPMDSRAQLALAWACAMSRQFDRAEIAYELAFQHNENDPWTVASVLAGFAFCGRRARAAALSAYLADLGLALEPFHWSYMAAAQFLAGDDAGCILMSERAREVSCDVPAWHAAALAHAGRVPEAQAVAGRFLALAREGWSHPQPPKDPEIAAWLLACFPIRSRESWNRLREGLLLAGLPVPGG